MLSFPSPPVWSLTPISWTTFAGVFCAFPPFLNFSHAEREKYYKIMLDLSGPFSGMKFCLVLPMTHSAKALETQLSCTFGCNRGVLCPPTGWWGELSGSPCFLCCGSRTQGSQDLTLGRRCRLLKQQLKASRVPALPWGLSRWQVYEIEIDI